MLLPIYLNTVNLIVGFPIRRCQSVFMNVAMWKHCTFDSDISGCFKVYYSNSIIINLHIITLQLV
jgi:hypothetical protein